MKFKRVKTLDELHQCISLGGVHYKEVEEAVTGFPYSPNLEVFEVEFLAGNIICAALWDEEELGGYVMLHKSRSLICEAYMASEVGMYIKPEYRGEGHLLTLLTLAESWLTDVDLVSISFKGEASIEGYELNEVSYVKRF